MLSVRPSVPTRPTTLDRPVAHLPGVGDKTARLLEKLEIRTVGDLIRHYPFRYLDLEKKKPISQVKIGEEVTVVGKVTKLERPRVRRRGLDLIVVWISDGSGLLAGVWFNQRYLATRLKEGDILALSGKVSLKYGRLQMDSPMYELLSSADGPSIHTGRIVPVHPTTAGLTTRQLRLFVRAALQTLKEEGGLTDPLPAHMARRYPSLEQALESVHFPESRQSLEAGRARLRFEELFCLQVALAVKRRQTEESPGIAHPADSPKAEQFLSELPFSLTQAQKRVLAEIRSDQTAPNPMHRLLHGDVGSGKTLVALAALLRAVDAGYQGALMAPTEVLAEQHFATARKMLAKYGIRLSLITGSQAAGDRKRQLDAVARGELDLVIGTHALIQEGVRFKTLSLVVIDEQHRFGVNQRVRLREKGDNPDTLVMTATPIPRTLALTFYGDLDVSVLDEMPSGRQPVKTLVISPRQRKQAYDHIRKQIAEGRQAYIICPVIDEQESDGAAVAALQEAQRLETEEFSDLTVACLHGRMRPPEKQAVMTAFARGEVAVLISTTVVEVGVDVPNASVMMIEGADRFGLSQLHQLRGRVGRGGHAAWCVLVSQASDPDGVKRMKAISETSDGFRLAEADLELRGEGQLFGARQSGFSDLRLASLPRDLAVLERARTAAFDLVAKDPQLSRGEHTLLRAEILRRYEDSIHWLSWG